MATGPINVDKVLTSVSEAYTNNSSDFIAEQLFPVITVDRKTGKYWAYNKDNLRVPANDLRTGRSKTNEATYGKSLEDWGPLSEHALKDFISQDELDLSDSPLNPETDVVNYLNEQMLIAEEKALADVLTDTSIITHNATPTNKWDTDNGDPFKDITSAIKTQHGNTMKNPNTMSFGFDVWLALINSKSLIDRVKYSERGFLSKEVLLAAFAPFGITNIVVGNVSVNDATEGQSDDLSTVWGKNVLLSYVTPTPGLRTINGGYTLRLRNGKYVDKWDDRDPKGEWVRNNDYYDQMLFNSDVFYLLTNVVS